MYGGPGIKGNLFNNLADIIGEPRVALITGPPIGSGSDVTYPVIGFVGVVVVAVDKTGEGVLVQLNPVLDPGAILGGKANAGVGQMVYRGISLTR